MVDERDYSLLAHNTFGIDVACRRFLEYDSVAEAQQVAAILRESTTPLLIIGQGSNLLLQGDFEGVVVHAAIKGMDAEVEGEDVLLRCGAGEVFDDVVDYAVAQGYHGAENLSFIPGEVGASAVQNIGAYGCEANDIIEVVEAVEIATGKLVHLTNADCDYAYRQSKFKHAWKNHFLLTHVTYRLHKNFHPHLDYGNIRQALKARGIANPSASALRETIIAIRNEKLPDPKVLGNAGSFFMNPVVEASVFQRLVAQYPAMPYYKVGDAAYKIPAGWLIEQCGWKGKALGRAGVYEKQALVLVNLGGATGHEIVALCHAIIEDVNARFGITIHPEVNIL